MHIGLYFGSFNPIHHGHLIIAEHILNSSFVDELWFMISPQNPFKNTSSLLNEYHRLNLAREAIEGVPRMKVSNIEFKLPKPSYTSDTLQYLLEKYPTNNFSIIMGSDGLQNFKKWKNYNFLLQNSSIIVYPRPGFEPIHIEGAKMEIAKAPLIDISSTHIRYLIKSRKSIRFLLPENVRLMIENNGYYLSASENPSEQ